MTLLPHQQSPHVDLPCETFNDLLGSKARERPDQEFLVFPESDRRFTYWEYHRLTLAASEWLKDQMPHASTLCLLFRNTPEFLASFFGAVALGITVVPINPDLAAAEILFIIENSEADGVLYDPNLEGKLAAVKLRIPNVAFRALAHVGEIPPVD